MRPSKDGERYALPHRILIKNSWKTSLGKQATQDDPRRGHKGGSRGCIPPPDLKRC